jgi:3D (Asp-Asp-Asp) domain-containing protein
MCAGETVCDLLEQTGTALGPLDRIQPAPETPLEPGMRVQITRVKALDITHRREIPPPVEYEPDPSLNRGTIEELQPGRPGLAEDITRVYYLNGDETTRIDMGSRVLVQPEHKVVRLGTRSLPQIVSRGNLSGRGVMTMIATAYDPGPLSCGRSATGRTATGHIATKGVCAVDPRVIPLGTRLWVEGYGYALACDTGGAIHGNRIDVCFDSRAEALRWGRRTVTVYILE